MRNTLLSLLLILPLISSAQDIRFYDELCDPLQRVFCDYVSAEGQTRQINTKHGRYIGNLINNRLYGWGHFISSDGSQSIGQFRNGSLLFGITFTDDVVSVGGETNFVEYHLNTGDIMRVHTNEGNIPLPEHYISTPGAPSPYSFEKIEYATGDFYWGETYNGRRHGYGIYFWKDGSIWYGKYADGYRQGYGVLFNPNGTVYYGKWIGDRKVE